jgi:hypothetical protein
MGAAFIIHCQHFPRWTRGRGGARHDLGARRRAPGSDLIDAIDAPDHIQGRSAHRDSQSWRLWSATRSSRPPPPLGPGERFRLKAPLRSRFDLPWATRLLEIDSPGQCGLPPPLPPACRYRRRVRARSLRRPGSSKREKSMERCWDRLSGCRARGCRRLTLAEQTEYRLSRAVIDAVVCGPLRMREPSKAARRL